MGVEFSRPMWGMQVNFGIKAEEIHTNNTNSTYKYNSNYCTFSMLFFPLKQRKMINPLLLAKAGINFQSNHIEDNARLLSIGGGFRIFFTERFGCELIVEKQSIRYKRISFGQDIFGHFLVNPYRISIGLMYEI